MSEHEQSREMQPLPRRGHVAGEVAAAVVDRDLTMDDATYAGMSATPTSEEQSKILTRGVDDRDVDIRPDGLVYMGAHRVRQRLNEAFRPGGWSLRRLTGVSTLVATEAQGDSDVELIMSAEYGLYAEGRFLASARGEMKYYDNGEMTYGDALEGTKSNALTRCSKDLGIALDLWDRSFGEQWKLQHAVKVWVKGKNKPQWRKLDAAPFYGETGIANDSPNQDKYVAPEPRAATTPERRQDPPPARPAPRAEAPRSREPGEDDDPGEPPAHHREEPRREAPRPASNGAASGGGRMISDAQRRRLYAKAMNSGFDRDSYRDMVRSITGDADDRNVTVTHYDALIAEAEAGPR